MQQPAITSVTVCSMSPQAYCGMPGILVYLSYQIRHSCPALLALIGFDKLCWQHQTLYLAPGMEVDFGGIVKEYAADAVTRLAREIGIAHGLVNLGGDFSVIGSKPDGSPWPVGIANPRQPKAMMARIDLLDGGLASSGDYARGF
jgi:thiamine biosynthesis lipoprotein